ncbi:unannotated protein [freshwater metagenome]|uniref:Unannotated protein n=1 Tax=freshwater metagenome TaxID=449393 RepID=A0A6J6WTD4_9ZZZZ
MIPRHEHFDVGIRESHGVLRVAGEAGAVRVRLRREDRAGLGV